MKRISWLTVAVCFSLISVSFAQSRLTAGLNLGLQMHPSRSQATPMLGASAWISAGKKFKWSAEYLFHNNVDHYPRGTETLVVVFLSNDHSKTHRAALGVHYPVMVHGQSSLTLLGISFGQSWDRREYRYVDVSNVPFMYNDQHDYVRRSILYASWTAMSQSRKMPFFLQARYGYSFEQESLTVTRHGKSFLQVVAGLHLGIF